MRAKYPVEVSIIVVSYNTCALTREAIESAVCETIDTSFEIIVVDNASSDGSAEMLATLPCRPHLLALERNIGFARANNLAARSASGDYILLLNPDTIVRDHAIDKLVAFAKACPEAGIWGGRTLFPDGSVNPASCWARMTLWNQFCRATGLTALFPRFQFFNGETLGGWPRNTSREVDIISGCFMLVDAELWGDLGGLDASFFMYGEEADFCLRAKAHGARPIVTPNAEIVHYGGASEAVRADKMVRLLAAKTTLIRRHWHSALRALGIALLAAWPLTRAIATTALAGISDRWIEPSATWRAIWWRRAEWLSGYEPDPTAVVASTERRAA